MISWKQFALVGIATFALACSSGPGGGRRYDGPGPVELHGHITTKSGAGPELEKVFHDAYYPAISSQAGFKYSNLLKVPKRDNKYLLTLAFESEDLRIRWAESDLHQEVWPQMLAQYSGEELDGVDAFGIIDPPM